MKSKILLRGRQALSVTLVAALIVLAPGLGCYEALATVVRVQSGAVETPTAVPGQVGVQALPNVSSQLTLSNPGLSAAIAAPQQLPSVQVSQAPTLKAVVLQLAAPAALPALAAPSAPVSQAVTVKPAVLQPAAPAQAAKKAPVTTQEALQAGAEKLSQAPAEGDKKSVLDEVYSGAKKAADSADAVSAGGAALSAAPALAPAAKAAPQTVADLQASANDVSRPFAERVAAVNAIAAAANDEAKASLKAIGQANPEGNAADYEVKRKALQALAVLGEVVSLPPVSRAHADEILKNLAADKPQAAAFDYDDTLERNQVPASAETAAALKASVDAGVETMILSSRSDRAGDFGRATTVLDSLGTLTPEQKQGLLVGTNRGSRLLVYDAKGEAKLIYEAPVWTAEERAVLTEVATQVKARYGEAAFQGQVGETTDYSFSLFLPVGLSAQDVEAAAEMMRSGLAARGVKAGIEGRMARNPANPSYLAVNKFGKDSGIKLLRENRDFYGRLRDVVQKLPAGLQNVATKLVGILPRSVVPDAKTLVVGDHFFGTRTEDLDMAKASPKGLGIAVGGTADPRGERVFVWPSKGHAATQEILGALARKDDSGLNKRALFGIFTSRSASIAAFFLTSTAYAFIAIPAVGLAAYGALMALGPLAAIALGPLSGLLAKKLSARNAMALNTVLSIGLLLALPVMSALGIVNFGTLLIASIGNGWVLSSVMTTEGIYVKRFSGKYVGTVNALTMIDYLSIQSLLGLILRAGRLTDYLTVAFPHLLVPYLIAAAVNAFIVLPLILRFVPNAKAADSAPQPGTEQAQARTWSDKLAGAKAFLKKYWKEALLFGVGLGLFPVLGTTIPAVAGLLYWVTRTEGFKVLWANKPLRYGLLAAAALAFLAYPFQSFGLPLIAEALAGKAGKSALLGQLLGALFFGQLISSTSQAQLPDVRLPFVGRIKAQRFIQAAVLGLLGTWTFMTLAPGSLLLTAAAVLGGAALMAVTSKLTDRGWIKYVGAGLAFLSLPLLFWGNIPALFACALMMGMFLGPANNALGTYFYKNIPAGQSEKTIGVRGSVFNGAVSMGYGIMSLLASHFHPAFPALLWPMLGAFLVVGLAFLFLPKLMPGLPDKAIKDKKSA